LKFEAAKNFKSYPGKGAEAVVGGKFLVVGNEKLMQDLGIENPNGKIQIPNKEIGTLVYVARDKEMLGLIVLEDKIRPESKKAIDAFHKMGIKVAMLTGDKKEIAEKVGRQLGIDTVFAQVLPEDKVNKVKELQDKGFIVGMVGDGVNDAPSLTQAHVGIAIGAGTDVAIESAEIVLIKNNPLDIVKVISLSRKTDIKMKQNLAWATGYNLLAIPAAAGVFYPWGITLRPEYGALLMSASSIIVVANALLLKRSKI
jgi:Cu2+-exporting ATPase